MTTTDLQPHDQALSLDDIRRKIDACDDGIIEILAMRFGFVDQVRQAKLADPKHLASLPLRPAREAQILRRIIAKAKQENLSPDLLVRLWPQIISEASQMQAPVTIHVPKKIHMSVAHRLRIRDYFGSMPVEESRDELQAMIQVDSNPADICIVETESNWAESFVNGRAGKAQVMAVLPPVTDHPLPKLLVIGHAPQDASGSDQTLVISKGALPRAFTPQAIWQAKSGVYKISALPGFLAAEQAPLASLHRSNPLLGLRVAGRYPAAIEL